MLQSQYLVTLMGSRRIAYWMGYKAGSNYADTGDARCCPDRRWITWQAAEQNGFGEFYQRGVTDGVLQKHGRFDQKNPVDLNDMPDP
jgi:hypothetical protein